VLIVEGGCSFLPEPAPLFRYTFPRCSHITVLQAKDHYARLKRRIIQVERGRSLSPHRRASFVRGRICVSKCSGPVNVCTRWLALGDHYVAQPPCSITVSHAQSHRRTARMVPPPCSIAGLTCNFAPPSSSPPWLVHHHSMSVTVQTRHHRSIGGQDSLRRLCPMRGAAFFSTCASSGDTDLSG
jgi:hypothetical protein